MDTETIEFIESQLEGKFQVEINRGKTRVVDLRAEGASLNFLGYTFRYDRGPEKSKSQISGSISV